MKSTPLGEGSQPIEDDGPRLLGAILSVTAVAVITMVARLFVRIRLIRNVGWDDYCMSFATILCITGVCVVIPEVHYGAGRHRANIPEKDFWTGYKLNFVTQPIYLIEIFIIKLSVGFFLLRIATTSFFRRTIQAIMYFMGFYTLGCFFTIMFQCTNLAVQWDPSVKGTCWTPSTIQALGYTNTACNIITDLLFAIIIPVPMLWHVQMNRRQKTSIICILGLGIFCVAAAAVKITYLPNYGITGDLLWDSRNITLWTIMESCVGIIAGNLPCLKPIFRSVLGSTYGRGSRGKTSGTGNTPHHPYNSRGTNTHTAKSQGFSSLNSSKARSHPDNHDDAIMMTTIGAAKDGSRAGSVASMREDGSSLRDSEGSSELLEKRGGAGLKLGGIMKTTQVTQTTVDGRKLASPRNREEPQEDLRPITDVRDMI